MMSVSLCQPDPRKSCGACCGLYNYRDDTTRAGLGTRLKRRTERFIRIDRPDPEALQAFSAWVRASESNGKLLETIYNCEYLGFVDPAHRRVGCLLHPALHRGRDLRSCSFYGAELCAGHLCLSYQKMTDEEKWCVVRSLDDWHLYGLCITDIDLCKSFFSIAAGRLGGQPSRAVLDRDGVREAARDFFSLKVCWPYRSADGARFGKYCLAEHEYREARIPYETIGCEPSRFDTIFRSLASAFDSVTALRRAESLVDGKIEAFVRACA